MILIWGGGGMFGGMFGGSWFGGLGIIGMLGICGGNIFGGGKLGGIILGGGIFRIRNKLWCKIVYELKIKCTYE